MMASARPTTSWADRLSWVALAVTILLGGGAVARAFPPAHPLDWAAAVLGLVAGAGAGVTDLVRRRVPNALTLPVIAAAIVIVGARLAAGAWGLAQVGAIILVWLVCLAAWLLRVVGGGDAKLAMGLLGLFPSFGAALAVGLGLLAGGLVYLLWGPHADGPSRLRAAVLRILARRAPPTRAEIEDAYRSRGTPAAPWLTIGFCVFLAVVALPMR